MSKFRYEAMDAAGAHHEGEVEASDVAAAIEMLGQQGMKVEMIQTVETRSPTPLPNSAGAAIAADQEFHQRVQSALDHRELILPPLRAIQEEFPASNDGGIRDLINLLHSEPNAKAWIHHQRTAAWLPILLVGPHGGRGQLTALLTQVIDRRKSSWQRYLRLIYPVVVLTLSLIVILFLGWFVIPIFSQMYAEFNMQLPTPTALSFWFSEQLVNHPIQSVFALLAIVIMIFAGPSLAKRFAWRWFGSLPGSVASVRAMARITDSLAELLSVGASLPEALRIAGNGCEHPYYRHQMNALAEIAESEQPSEFRTFASRWIPGNVVEALNFGERAEPNVCLLRDLSALYQRRVDQKSAWLVGAIGPVMIVALGGVVGFIVVSLFMPLIYLISGLS